MAKKKGEKAQRSRLSRLFHILISTPGRQIILVALFIALLAWRWPTVEDIARSTWLTLGWGLIIILTGIGIVAVRLRQREFASFARHWNRWLGGIVFALALWGILAFFALGGNFGLSIIGQPGFIGALRILGLTVISMILVAPATSFHAAADLFAWLSRQFEKRQAARTVSQKPEREPVLARREISRISGESPAAVTPVTPEKEPATNEPSSPKELRQVAQEVWKKYGQASNLTVVDGWRLPPIDILERSPEVEFSQADNAQRARLIEEALASYGVDTKVVQINTGPTVTQFGVEPGWDRKFKEIKEKDKDGNVQVRQEEVAKTRVKVERITSLANDLALALAAATIRIEAPVPGKSIVGIEVPNTISSLVSLRGVVETSSFQKLLTKSKMAVALGKGAGGEAVAADLTRMPHLLVAGATGSGKTVCLNTIISCLLLHNTPNDVRFVMIDPKRVELTPYNSIPHLASPVIVDTQKALSALRWLSQEMDQRYQKLAAAGARNIEGFNKNKMGNAKLPYIVLIIDELADLMMTGFDEVETILCRLAQLARATGIHLVVATQRPSVDVITGLIKANFPTRISFAVTSQVDSRTILDSGGAEKLLGRGDMLFMPTEAAKPKRLQGCFLSDPEMERLVYFWGSQRRETLGEFKIDELVTAQATAGGGVIPPDPLLDAARQLAKEHGNLSTSFLQRKLHIGYPRAARLMEQLEEEGVKRVEEPNPPKPTTP
ncbi:MAG: DNA translocase FtsK [Chloroflexi bacterium]|nr:DNA translocase FtsK [Chloroflexota bacterium]